MSTTDLIFKVIDRSFSRGELTKPSSSDSFLLFGLFIWSIYLFLLDFTGYSVVFLTLLTSRFYGFYLVPDILDLI